MAHQLANELVRMQELLDKLERLICQQAAYPESSLEDLLQTEKVKLSKKENQARNAGGKARDAFQERQTAWATLHELRAKFDKAKGNDDGDATIKAARKGFYEADENAVKEVRRAIEKLKVVYTSRATSSSRREEEDASKAARQAQEGQDAIDQQDHQAQEATLRQAPEDQEAKVLGSTRGGLIDYSWTGI